MCDNPPTSTDMCKCAKRLIRNKVSLSATPTAVWIRVMLGDFNKKKVRKGASFQYTQAPCGLFFIVQYILNKGQKRDYLESNTISGLSLL